MLAVSPEDYQWRNVAHVDVKSALYRPSQLARCLVDDSDHWYDSERGKLKPHMISILQPWCYITGRGNNILGM